MFAVAFGLALFSGATFASDEQPPIHVDADGQRGASAEQAPSDKPLPPVRVEIIEDKAEAEARKRREKESAQREISDLVAQEGMNAATKRMADYAFHQTWIVAIGTALLIGTLILTWQANRAAVAAANAAERTFYAQHRPKLVVRQAIAPINDPEDHTIVVVYTMSNVGDTECWITEGHIGIDFVTSDGYPAISLPPQLAYPNNPPHIGRIAPGESISCTYIDPTHRWDRDHRADWAQKTGVYFCGFLSYLDTPGSGIRRQMAFRRKYDINTQRFHRIKDGDPDDDFED